jgi:hypothetical protein
VLSHGNYHVLRAEHSEPSETWLQPVIFEVGSRYRAFQAHYNIHTETYHRENGFITACTLHSICEACQMFNVTNNGPHVFCVLQVQPSEVSVEVSSSFVYPQYHTATLQCLNLLTMISRSGIGQVCRTRHFVPPGL